MINPILLLVLLGFVLYLLLVEKEIIFGIFDSLYRSLHKEKNKCPEVYDPDEEVE